MRDQFRGKHAAAYRKAAAAEQAAKARHTAWLASLTPAQRNLFRQLDKEIGECFAWCNQALAGLNDGSITREQYIQKNAEREALEAQMAQLKRGN